MKKWKIIFKKCMRNRGLEMHRSDYSTSPVLHIVSTLKRYEQLSAVNNKLLNAGSADSNWEIIERYTLDVDDGFVETNIAGNSASNSTLPMLYSLVNAAPESSYIPSELVGLNRFDFVAREYLQQFNFPFFKIATRGVELDLLDVARGILVGMRECCWSYR